MKKSDRQVFKSFLEKQAGIIRANQKETRGREKHLRTANLDSLAREALDYENLISVEHKQGIRESVGLDKLYEKSEEVEEALRGRLFAGERIKKPLTVGGREVQPSFLEYVFVNFHRHRDCNVLSLQEPPSVKYAASALSLIPEISKFVQVVGKYEGESLLFTHRHSTYARPKEFELDFAVKGVVNGTRKFATKRMGKCHHKVFFIPVSEMMFASRENPAWKSDEGNRLDLNNESFDPEARATESSDFISNLSNGVELGCTEGPYLGGNVSHTQSMLYVGNKLAKKICEEGLLLRPRSIKLEI